ncbi:MAG TPA: hypothetical protein EYQ50_03915 [Verrucomicrobiales bacterium]|nr:hypothetical protein [Verrucomicrobiales bacterium]HIL69087.1 hypothetical protein [Verrucomicrobiota bacterium]
MNHIVTTQRDNGVNRSAAGALGLIMWTLLVAGCDQKEPSNSIIAEATRKMGDEVQTVGGANQATSEKSGHSDEINQGTISKEPSRITPVSNAKPGLLARRLKLNGVLHSDSMRLALINGTSFMEGQAQEVSLFFNKLLIECLSIQNRSVDILVGKSKIPHRLELEEKVYPIETCNHKVPNSAQE